MDKDFITKFGGAVLAGGASKRMGFNKALVEINGEPLISKVANSLNRAGVVLSLIHISEPTRPY